MNARPRRQLLSELVELRQRIVELEVSETERERSEEALQQRNHQLALLNQAGRVFSSTLDLNEVLTTVLDEVRRLMGVTACSVWLVDPETDELVAGKPSAPEARPCAAGAWRWERGLLAGWPAEARA